MSLLELLEGPYSWLLAGRVAILWTAVLIPMAGTLLARIGKAGRSDADGRWIASTLVGVGLAAVVLRWQRCSSRMPHWGEGWAKGASVPLCATTSPWRSCWTAWPR